MATNVNTLEYKCIFTKTEVPFNGCVCMSLLYYVQETHDSNYARLGEVTLPSSLPCNQ